MMKIGITHGDINGVAYETILKAFENNEILSLFTPLVYGSPKVAAYHKKGINSPTTFQVIDSADAATDGVLNLVNVFGETEHKIEYGKPTAEAGAAAVDALKVAIADLKEGVIDALVSMPMNDNCVPKTNGKPFVGQSAYINAELGSEHKTLDMFVSDKVRIALATTDLPLAEVKTNITNESVAEKLIMLHNTLKRDFYIDNPRIAVLALNPKYNVEDETSDEAQIIAPVIDELFKRGVRCFGPYSAENFFGSGDFKHFDATLAMYYDQGATPFRLLAGDGGVRYMAGMPYVVTSPARDPEYNIAGKNQADENPLRQAIYTAIDVMRNRTQFDDNRRDPLKKQYFERRDDSDKLKLDSTND